MVLVSFRASGAGVLWCALMTCFPAAGAGQISPGPLARAHGALEGTLKCTSCHAGGKEALSGNCLTCHKDIGWLADRSRGLHGLEGKTDCASCHPDHAGADFALINWKEGSAERFDHGRTGWTLEGSHLQVKCGSCHTAEFRVSPAAKLSVRRGPYVGWTGLERNCVSCHADPHRGALDQRCTSCHDARKWTRTPGFDHARTNYPLTGAHASVACAKCHLDPHLPLSHDTSGAAVPIYRPVPHQQCSSCHQDPHAGRLGPNCASCHSTRGFKLIDKDGFDHDRTRYPLRGGHAVVRCTGCHDFSTPAGKHPAFASCGACHRDAHAGAATLAGKPADCAACHSVEGFAPSTYGVVQHRSTKYPLEGRHQQVACSACHLKNPPGVPPERLGPARVLLRPAFSSCRSCHADDHGGQFAVRADRGDCAVCHRPAGWRPSNFTLAEHARLRLPLEGRHAEVPCGACHGPDRKGLPLLPAGLSLGRVRMAFALREVTCEACHTDPHDGRFAAGGARAKNQGCPACHNAVAFRPSTIDVAVHQRFAFPLEGAHRAVSCAACHEEMKRTSTGPSLVGSSGRATLHLSFTGKAGGCAGCHANPHGAQFASRKDAGACESCHGSEAFAPALKFDHDRDASFSLKGAHERVPCNRCHQSDLGAPGTGRLIYRPLSGRCESCHGAKS